MTLPGVELAGLGLFVFSTYCAQRSDPPAQTTAAVTATVASAVAVTEPVVTPPSPVAVAVEAPAPKKTPHVVLHIGDSMVGYGHGLSLAMKKRYEGAGVEYHWDAWTSAQIYTIDKKRMDKLLGAYKPDLVLFNLGTNMMSMPHPEAFADGIKKLAAHLAENGRECVWIAPIRPKWSYNPKIYDVLQENVAPCKYFDAGPIDPVLQTDHIHPTDAGGEQWAAPLWNFLQADV